MWKGFNLKFIVENPQFGYGDQEFDLSLILLFIIRVIRWFFIDARMVMIVCRSRTRGKKIENERIKFHRIFKLCSK